MKRIDLSGQQFGQLRVLGPASMVNKHLRWNCICACGAECQVSGEGLRKGIAISCGCNQRKGRGNTTHGLNTGGTHPLAGTWSGIQQRCFNPNAQRYNRYGGRGITVCDRWLNGADGKPGFQCFVEDMGPKPTPEHSIERKDKDGNYEPGNCHWALDVEQARNRRTTVEVDLDGERVSLAEYCERKGLTYKIVHQRLSRGWSLEKASSPIVSPAQRPRAEARA
ncbi:hypothetical protein C8D77_101248 [Mesorhizobium loti]|uniref:HNH endonuclease n=1 Tax=Rhizobium loti TaxID=381 RepID=A0A8E2WFM7_RHILI|nr:hypothetical protein [Mesorhizobium loti]PWJ93569.1 hypothetical protein C8D77_101248 [Mesorhizobium loti]